MKTIHLEKTTLILAGLLLALLLNLASASAQTGCFTYKESTFYCSDLSQVQAEEECSLYEKCNLEKNYFPQKSCGSNSNEQQFPQCQLVLCKSSCNKELSGKCAAGEVPENEMVSWCSPGCCRFDYMGGSFCEFKENKGLCEIEARNKEAPGFNFNQQLSEEECLDICSQQLFLGTKITEGLVLEKVSEFSEFQPQLQEPLTVSESEIEDIVESVGVPEEKPQKSSSMILWVILLIIFVLAMYYFFSKNKLFFRKFREEISLKKKSLKEKPSPWWLHPFFSPELRRKLQTLRLKRKHKIKEFEKETVLSEFGPKAKLSVKKEFRKLKGLIREYKMKKKRLTKFPEEKSTFEKLEELSTKIKEKEQKIVGEFSEVSPQIIKKPEQDKIITELRKLAREK